MANLIRLCNGSNGKLLKPLFNWKFEGKLTTVAKPRINSKWYHFTKRKLQSNAGEPLSVHVKFSIGFLAGISVKFIRDNSVYCVKQSGTRLAVCEHCGTNPNFNWSKFWKLLKLYWLELFGAILTALICALLNIQIPRALGNIVDVLSKMSGGKPNFLSEMKKPAFKVITFYTLQSFFTFLYIVLLAHVGEGIAKTMKLQMFSSIMKQDMEFFDSHRSGELLNRLTVDIQDFKSSFKMVISQGLRHITQIIGCSISLFFISPSMTGVMLVVVPTSILVGTCVGALLRQLSYEAKAQGAQVTLVTEEAISNIRTVRAFAMEDLENKIVDEQTEIWKKMNVKLAYGIALFQAGTNLFLNGMVLSTIYLGGYMMTMGNLSAGDLMAFLVAVQMLQRSFTQISLLFGMYIKGKHAGARVFEIIDLAPGKTLSDGKKIPYHTFFPNVRFKNVVFSYPSRPHRDVLKNINLYIPEGKTVAIVGSSGSGKSTMAWLIERFYDVQKGFVLIGDEDIRNLDSNWLRKNVIGFISQEPVLFATTILENIRYGNPSATDAEVMEAAKLANADTFIREFPAGYQTMVGERGIAVSGGQKQRIAIARALLKNPSILILDEATSALDSESEKAVQESFENITKSRTTIVIAHRLSTVKKADFIVVLNDGIIVESGTHRELLARNGVYAALVAHQVENI